MSAELIVPVIALARPACLVFIHKHFRYKEKLLELQGRGGSAQLLHAVAKSSDGRVAELEARVQNLESIIVAMDSELGALPGRAGREDLGRIVGAKAAPALAAPAAIPPPDRPADPSEPPT